jgi:GNAT superfamily N-acetyltransferase
VRIRDVDTVAESFGEFGMLVVDPGHRGFGVGRQLVDFAERRSRANGRRAMRLELLVPRTWVHPDKEFLKAWYGRRGYEVVRTTTLDESYPHIAPLLATPCELGIYEKPL